MIGQQQVVRVAQGCRRDGGIFFRRWRGELRALVYTDGTPVNLLDKWVRAGLRLDMHGRNYLWDVGGAGQGDAGGWLE